jgi:hypothetical protein
MLPNNVLSNPNCPPLVTNSDFTFHLTFRMTQAPCEICQALRQRQTDRSNGVLNFEYPLEVLHQGAEKCAGICLPLLRCLKEVVPTEDRARTQAITLGGGRGSPALLRIAGADADYNVTFEVEYYISERGISLQL